LRIQLHPGPKTYWTSRIEGWSERVGRLRQLPQVEATSADVTTTFDVVDTGERRRVGGFTARRVKTTIVVDPSPGANTKPRTQHVDGWYIDLPGYDCFDTQPGFAMLSGEAVPAGGARDRHHFKTLGRARRGYPLDETSRDVDDGRSYVSTRELVSISEVRLDPALFEIPRTYQRALATFYGGYDPTKPDTLSNRVALYWAELVRWTESMWR
jgi:hypothetical protein